MKAASSGRDHVARIPLISGAVSPLRGGAIKVYGRPFTTYFEAGSSDGVSIALEGSWNLFAWHRIEDLIGDESSNAHVRWKSKGACGWPFVTMRLVAISSGQLGNCYILAPPYLV
jgi:hypothetical protein